MPTIDGGWLDQYQRFPPPGPQPPQKQPQQTVIWAKVFLRTSEDAELVMQGKSLEQEVSTRPSRSDRSTRPDDGSHPRRVPTGDANVNGFCRTQYWRGTTRHVINRAATALRLAATTLLRSQSYLGAQYRRLRGRLGAPKAITAMAHKLARLVYRLLKWGHAYVDKGQQYYEERHREQQLQRLKQRAAKLGLLLVAPEVA
jgi:hypothetical protein